MASDPPAPPIDDSASDCDRLLDGVRNIKASRPNATALRTMFADCPTADKFADKAPVVAKQDVQQSKWKSSFLLTPSI